MELESNIFTLPNGVRIISQKVPAVRSAALGIWVSTGSRYETPQESGAAHFIEHMVFKGTQRRTAQELAQEMDTIGGQVNAYTSKESTCFYARCLDEHLHQALDLLCDMVFCSKFDESDVQTERGVILEEIGMYEDTPEDVCMEQLSAAIYKDTGLGRPILGTKETLDQMTGAWLKAYKDAHYRPERIVVSLAGSFEDVIIEAIKARFAGLTPGNHPDITPVTYQQSLVTKEKPIEQNHLILAFPAMEYSNPRRFELQVLISLLGGGMSSRLFQEVREKRGLCYSVYAFGGGNQETGMVGVCTALNKETEAQAITAICEVISDLVAQGPTQDEVNRVRDQAKTNILMGLESTQARMEHLGRGLLLHGKALSTDEVVAAYDAVTVEKVQTLAAEIFDFSQATLSVVGNISPLEEYKALLGQG